MYGVCLPRSGFVQQLIYWLFMSVILIISPEHWKDHSVSKHHYARTLAERGVRVFFLNPPDDFQSGFKIEKEGVIPSLYIVSAPKVASGLRFYPAILRRWLEERWLARFEKVIDTKIDIIWLFENSRFFDMRFAGDRLKIYHQVDLNQDFHLKLAVSTADICFCVTDSIKNRIIQLTPKCYKISHGLSKFPKKYFLSEKQLRRFEGNTLHAVYVGNLDMQYLNAELLTEVAQRNIDVRFHFVGGYSEKGVLRSLAGHLKNVIWWGRVESSLLSSIFERADVLLLAYRAELYPEQVDNSHKIMEYLASGKIIVATYTGEYQDKRHLLEMVDNSSEYVAAFERVLNGLSHYNSHERQKDRIEFSRQHTYDKQLDKIFDLLKKHDLYQKIEKGNRQYDI
ncbi:MAG: glycosyltransferase [Candidatus Electrothrix communis]|nr:MAG: glycosyltransferase [Candidatus Electrothrix communis]